MASKSNNSIAIIIPAFNEEKVIGLCVDDVIKAIRQISNKILLVVINDGSHDKTGEILAKKEKMYKGKLIVLNHKKNKGYGAANQTGIDYAIKNGFVWALHMDSDLTNDPKYIKTFAKFATEKFDCIKASRYIKGSKTKNVPSFRIYISTVGNFIARNLFRVGLKDCTNGFRMVRLEKIKGVRFRENNFALILEELYYLKKSKSKFYEIPYTLTARTNSVSHFIYKPSTFRDYIKYAIRSFFIR